MSVTRVPPTAANREASGRMPRTSMVRFLRICASQNDLFALDVDGDVYRYNFDTKAWTMLGRDIEETEQTRHQTDDEGV